MGDSHGASHGNLLSEQWYNRAIRTKDISESCGDKLRNTLNLAIQDSLIERLAVYLAYTL